MQACWFWVLVLLFSSVRDCESRNPEIGIVDLWGTISVKPDVEQNITCMVVDPLDDGQIVWKLNDEVLVNNNRLVVEEDDVLVQSLQFMPSIDDDKKSVTCSYVREQKTLSQESLTLSVDVLDIPEEVTIAMVKEGKSTILQVGVHINPPPTNESIYWQIDQPNGDMWISLYPGSRDPAGKYLAHKTEVVQKYRYVYRLVISSLDREEVARRHYLKIEHGGATHTVRFQLSIEYKEEIEEIEEKSEEETAALGMGVWVVLGIILLIIIIIIVIVCCRKKKKIYSPVRQGEIQTQQKHLGEH